jgi:glycine dehydrogenase subunit 1
MAFIPHTPADVEAMLAAIGARSIEDLFDEIPAGLRVKSLAGVPDELNEMQVGRLMSERARLDGRPLCFIGAGAYEHHIPAAVWAITTRGEFYSAYTPYQAEASQGTLQLIYEYQTMIASLTGMQVSNASVYDGASAVAEASLMAVRANRKSKSLRILVPTTVHPHYRKVAVATAGNQGLRFEELPYSQRRGRARYDLAREVRGRGHHGDGHPAAELLRPARGCGCADRLGARARDFVIAVVNPTSLALLKPPGSWGTKGADIAVGDGQPLGCRCLPAVRTSAS